MTDNFTKAVEAVFNREGYGNAALKGDPGGLTVWGLSAAAYPNIVPVLAKMSADEAKKEARKIYYHDYWRAAGCDDFPSPLDAVIFDTAVNCGLGRAKEFRTGATSWQEVLCNRVRWQIYTSKSRYTVGLLNRILDVFNMAKEG